MTGSDVSWNLQTRTEDGRWMGLRRAVKAKSCYNERLDVESWLAKRSCQAGGSRFPQAEWASPRGPGCSVDSKAQWIPAR